MCMYVCMRRLQRPISTNLYYDYSHAIIFGVNITKKLVPGLRLIPRIGSAGTLYSARSLLTDLVARTQNS